MLQVERTAAIGLLNELGIKAINGKKVPSSQIEEKLNNLKMLDIADETTEVSADNQKLLKDVLSAIDLDDKVVVVSAETKNGHVPKKPAPKAVKEKKSAKATKKTVAPKVVKEKKPRKEEKAAKKPESKRTYGDAIRGKIRKPHGLSMRERIVQLLKAASKTKPIDRFAIAKVLEKEWSKNDPGGIMKSIQWHLSWGIKQKDGLEIQRNENGYWIK